MSFDENDFLTLAQRYKELASSASDEPGGHEDMMYDLSGYLVEIEHRSDRCRLYEQPFC